MSQSNTTPTPTFSMQPVRYEDGTWGVSVQVTGLTTERQAEAAMDHMQRLFCGAGIESDESTQRKTTCPTCEALARTVMMDQTGAA